MIEINYTPATIHCKKDFYIDWYLIIDGKRIRKKIRLNNIAENRRKVYAAMLCDQINNYLERNLDPYQHIPLLRSRMKKHGSDADFLHDVTFIDGSNKYLLLLSKKGRKDETTGISYKYIYKQFNDWMAANFPQIRYVHQIKDNHVVSYFDFLLSKPVS